MDSNVYKKIKEMVYVGYTLYQRHYTKTKSRQCSGNQIDFPGKNIVF